MQTPEAAFTGGHKPSVTCHRMAARWTQHETTKTVHKALANKFTAYGIELKRVNEFKYLGRPTLFVNSDIPALRHNLKKARGVLQRISQVLRVGNIPAPICAMFYKAVVMAVLMYRSGS